MNQLRARTRSIVLSLFGAVVANTNAAEPALQPAPAIDRVGFPKDYQTTFEVLRTVTRKKELKIVTVYGNKEAASITSAAQLPYPYGSILVMETALALKDAEGKPALDAAGELRRDKIAGLHVMRRERGFGEAYGRNRTAEWEYVEYHADGTTITPAPKSATCAECHVKAGAAKDFVYEARIGGQFAKPSAK